MMRCARLNLDRNICTSNVSSRVSYREKYCRLTCGLCTVKRRQELQAPLYALLEVKPQTPTDWPLAAGSMALALGVQNVGLFVSLMSLVP